MQELFPARLLTGRAPRGDSGRIRERHRPRTRRARAGRNDASRALANRPARLDPRPRARLRRLSGWMGWRGRFIGSAEIDMSSVTRHPCGEPAAFGSSSPVDVTKGVAYGLLAGDVASHLEPEELRSSQENGHVEVRLRLDAPARQPRPPRMATESSC